MLRLRSSAIKTCSDEMLRFAQDPSDPESPVCSSYGLICRRGAHSSGVSAFRMHFWLNRRSSTKSFPRRNNSHFIKKNNNERKIIPPKLLQTGRDKTVNYLRPRKVPFVSKSYFRFPQITSFYLQIFYLIFITHWVNLL